MERGEPLQVMDELEALVMREGWPVPFSPYYLVHHEKMLALLDRLRISLQDEMDHRFIKAFAEQLEAEKKSAALNVSKKATNKGKGE